MKNILFFVFTLLFVAPVFADLVNPSVKIYTATVSAADAVSLESRNGKTFDWITSNCTSAVTGRAVCNLESGNFAGTPHCSASANSTFAGRFCGITSSSSSSIQIDCFDADAPGTSNAEFQLKCVDSAP